MAIIAAILSRNPTHLWKGCWHQHQVAFGQPNLQARQVQLFHFEDKTEIQSVGAYAVGTHLDVTVERCLVKIRIALLQGWSNERLNLSNIHLKIVQTHTCARTQRTRTHTHACTLRLRLYQPR